MLLEQTGHAREAESAYRDALQGCRQLAAELPGVPEYRHNLASTHHELGLLLAGMGRVTEAELAYRNAITLHTELATHFPAVSSYRHDLAKHHNNLGNALMSIGRPKDAERAYREALGLYTQLAANFPLVPPPGHQPTASRNNHGVPLQDSRRPHDPGASREEIVFYHAAAPVEPSALAYAIELGGTKCNLGNALRDQGSSKAALAWYAEAISTLDAVLVKDSTNITAREYLCSSHWGRAVALMLLGRHTEALRDYDRAVDLDPGRNQRLRLQRAVVLARVNDHTRATAEANDLVGVPNADASTLYEAACVFALSVTATMDDAKRGEAYATRAVELLRRAVSNGYKDLQYLKQDQRLEPLRSNPEFRKLLKQLESSPHGTL
jgi:tetratricopeptide (TPR) repeat protein